MSMSAFSKTEIDNRLVEQKGGLHQKLNTEMFLELKKFFANRDNEITKEEFRRRLKMICGLTYEDDEFNLLYMKIDSERFPILVEFFMSNIKSDFSDEEIL